MTRDFKYDIVQLIHAVRDRPCLWDKTLEVYKDRIERRNAWEEIFRYLDDKYDESTNEAKRLIEEQILTKWTNVRDTFLKTLKIKMGKPKRKYLLYEHLKFLTKIYPQQHPEETAEAVESNTDSNEDYHKIAEYVKINEKVQKSCKKKSKRSTSSEEYVPSKKVTSKSASELEDGVDDSHFDENVVNFVDYNEGNEPRLMNEDEAFFASLLPTVVRYSLEERLDFRMEVLAVMKRIHDKRKWSE